MFAGMNVQAWPPRTWIGLSALTSVPVRSALVGVPDTTCSTSPWFNAICPAPLAGTPAPARTTPPVAEGASVTVVPSCEAATE